MPINYTAKWEPLDGSTPLQFTDPYGIEEWGEDKFSYRIPTAETPGDGEASADGSLEPRIVSVAGLLTGIDADEFAARWDTLTKALSNGGQGRLYKSTERFLVCRVVSVPRPADDGIENTRWEAVFRASDPLYYDSTVTNQSLATSGSTSFTVGGTYFAIPSVVLNVSAAPANSSITVTVGVGGIDTVFILRPTGTGVHTIDSNAGTVLRVTTDRIADFSGSFLDAGIGTGSVTFTLALSGGATLSSASVQYRKRYIGA